MRPSARVRLLSAVGWVSALTIGCSREDGPPGARYDAGPVFASQTAFIVQRFSIANTTNRKVNILGETHNCSCTEARLGDRRSLMPGDSTSLELRVRVPQSYSKQEVSCQVKTDHPDFPVWVYQIRYESYPVAQVVPATIDLGEYVSGMASREEGLEHSTVSNAHLDIYYRMGDPPPPAPPKALPARGPLLVEIDDGPDISELNGGVRRARYRIRTRLEKAGLNPGIHSGEIAIPIEGRTTATAIAVWRCRAPVEATPAQLHFGMATPGDVGITKSVTIRSSGGETIGIRHVDVDCEFITLSDPEKTSGGPLNKLTATLKIPSGRHAKVLSGTIVVSTDNPECAQLEVPWSAFVRQGPGPDVLP